MQTFIDFSKWLQFIYKQYLLYVIIQELNQWQKYRSDNFLSQELLQQTNYWECNHHLHLDFVFLFLHV